MLTMSDDRYRTPSPSRLERMAPDAPVKVIAPRTPMKLTEELDIPFAPKKDRSNQAAFYARIWHDWFGKVLSRSAKKTKHLSN